MSKETIEALLKKFPANRIAVLARDAEKAADYASHGGIVRTGDYADYDSLEVAFSGVEKLLLISTGLFRKCT